MIRISYALMLAGLFLPSAAQSVYPGQHTGNFAIETSAPLKAKAFDLSFLDPGKNIQPRYTPTAAKI